MLMYKFKLKLFYIKQILKGNAKLKFRCNSNGLLFAANPFGFCKLI